MKWPEITRENRNPSPVEKPRFTRYRVRPLADFVTVSGKVKQIYGCSFADNEEFIERIQYLRDRISEEDSDKTFEQLLDDPLILESVKRCLELHGLTLRDVSLRHIQDLLLYEVVDGELQPGFLVRLNQPRDKDSLEQDTLTQLGHDTKKLSYERALAIIASHTQSVEEAVRITYLMSTEQLMSFLASKAELMKTPDKNEKTKDLLKYLDTPESNLISVSEDML